MNKLAILAFSCLLFFSAMLWYLANNSLNDHLNSQVTLQSKYYSTLDAKLTSSEFSTETGMLVFNQYQLSNIEGFTQPLLISVDKVSAQLAKSPTKTLNSPSIQKKTTTLVNIETLTFNNVVVWKEESSAGETNIEQVLEQVTTKLASDYPALYPEVSAKLYANKHPERNELLVLSTQEQQKKQLTKPMTVSESNQAIIASKKEKQQKRLLGKALTRIKINKVMIDKLTVKTLVKKAEKKQVFSNVSLEALGDKNGLASNQLGGEILKRLLEKVSGVSKN